MQGKEAEKEINYVKEENRWGELGIIGVPEEETRIVGTEQSSEEIEIIKGLLSSWKS